MHTQKSACAHTIKHALLLSGSNTCAQKATSPFTVLLREPHQISTLHRTRETKHTHAHTYTHSHFAKRSNIHIATDSSCTSLKLSHVKKVVIVRDEQKTICVRAGRHESWALKQSKKQEKPNRHFDFAILTCPTPALELWVQSYARRHALHLYHTPALEL